MNNWNSLYNRDLMAWIPSERGVIAKQDFLLSRRFWWCRRLGELFGELKETFTEAVEYVFGGRS